MNITRIFDEFEKGNICVFKDLVEARHSLIEYAMTGKSIEKKYAITINAFKNYFVEDKGDKLSITPVMRYLFVIEFLQSNNLSYFIGVGHPESLDRLSLFVSKLLPSLKRLKDSKAYKLLDQKMIDDVELLYSSYNKFLSEKDLYEVNYNEYKITNADEFIMSETYSIIASDTMEDLKRFYSNIDKPSNIIFVNSLDEDGKVKLEAFGNCAEENSVQIRRIAYLLDNGVNINDIALTLSDFDNQIDDIKREAKKYNIPLSLKPVSLLKKHSDCSYFYGLKNLYIERFSLSTMKEFFLDGGLYFNHQSQKRFLIRIGIDANINHGLIDNPNDTWSEKLNSKNVSANQKELYSSLSSFYKEFKTKVVALNEASTEEDVKFCLLSLESLLFKNEDKENDENANPSDAYIRVKSEFKVYFDALNYCEIKVQKNLFSHLVDFLDDVKYEEKAKSDSSGIQVYSYPESSTLNYKYHFILGMNHGATETIYKPLDILPSLIDEELREEENLTYPIINDYITNSGNTYISYGCDTYSGSQLPPSFFIERNLSGDGRLNLPLVENPYKNEELFFSRRKDYFKPVLLQIEGFKKADLTVLSSSRFNLADKKMDERDLIDEFLAVSTNDKGEIKLSSTSIDIFMKCPFKWMLKYGMKIYEHPFDIVPLDHREVGTFLHKIMEVFFRKVKEEDKRFFSANLDKYNQMLSDIFDDELLKYSKGDKSPTPSSLIYIEDAFKSKVMKILKSECKNFDGLESLGFEKRLEYHDVLISESFKIPFYIDGLIDRIVTLENQGFAIIDYKKNKATVKEKSFRSGIIETGELKSYQFPCYRALMNNNDMDAKSAAYYGFNDGQYEFVFQNDDEFLIKIDEIFNNVIKNMLLSIKGGDFKTTPSRDNCENCSFRQICRKRYSTK